MSFEGFNIRIPGVYQVLRHSFSNAGNTGQVYVSEMIQNAVASGNTNQIMPQLEGINMLPCLIAYLIVISLLAVFLTIRDKHAAKRQRWRVKERTLLLVSALGGSAAMLLAMLTIRHKTKHSKFMIGIPVILTMQIAVLVLWWQAKGGFVL